MGPFKNKENKWKPKSPIDYFLLGLKVQMQMRKKFGRQPRYTPSKIIQPKQLT
jgi:hypothetical protein